MMNNTLLVLVVMSFILGFACIAIASTKRVMSIIALAIMSLLSAFVYLVLDAPDVALTEAAVGACISSCILLFGLKRLGSIAPTAQWSVLSFICYALPCILLFVLISYYSLDLHEYGAMPNEFQTGLTEFYKANAMNQIGIKSLVTSILADYRGIDTFCETLVIFTAGIGTIFVLSNQRKI